MLEKGVFISKNCKFFGGGMLSIGSGSRLNDGVIIGVDKRIIIGKNVLIGPYVGIYDFNHGYESSALIDHQPLKSQDVIIEDNVWVGHGSTITKGVRIGEGSVVGAGAFVTKDVDPFSIVGGVPAKLLRMIH